MQKYNYAKLWVFSFLFCFFLLISNVYADAIYWKRPIKYNQFDDNLKTNFVIFPAEMNGKSANLSKNKHTHYYNIMEHFGSYLWNYKILKMFDNYKLYSLNYNFFNIFISKLSNKNQATIVYQGEFKSSNKELMTFYLNNCFALIVNTKDKIYMLHGRPIEHPKFSKDTKKIKEKLNLLEGEIYLISHQAYDLLEFLPKDKKIYIHEKADNLVNSLKVSKNEKDLIIEAEFHPNEGVNQSNIKKLLAHMPWGPLEPITFRPIR